MMRRRARRQPVREGQYLAAPHDGIVSLPGAEGGTAVQTEGGAHGPDAPCV